MTPYLFLLTYGAGVLATFVRGPMYGLYLYTFAFYFSPYGTWWESYVPDLRYLQIAALVTLAATILHGTWWQTERHPLSRGMTIFAWFLLWIWITSLWALTGHWQEYARELFTKHFVIALLIIMIVRNFDQLKNFLLLHVVGCAWLGWMAWGKSGSRLEGIAGALSDANTLGMHLAAILIIAGMLFLGCRGYHRWVSFLCIPWILNTVVLSGSRGAFLGLLAGGLAAAWYCPKELRTRFSMAGGLAVVLFVMLASESFLERLESLRALGEGAEEVDKTSAGRLEIAAAGWEMYKDHPMGIGFKGTAVLSPRYMQEERLTAGGTSRSAHNSLMSVLVDYSVVGLALYLLIYAWTWRSLATTSKAFPGDTTVGAICAGIAGALAVVLVAGQSSDYYEQEIQYWLLATAVVLQGLRIIAEKNAVDGAVNPLATGEPQKGTLSSPPQRNHVPDPQ